MLEIPESFDQSASADQQFYVIVSHSLGELEKEVELETDDWDDEERDEEYTRRFRIFASEVEKLAAALQVSRPFTVDFAGAEAEYWPAIMRSAILRWAISPRDTHFDPRLRVDIEIEPDFRISIRDLTRRIRQVILKADISDSVSERLETRLSAFERELDKRKSNLESAVSVWLDVTQAVGEGIGNLDAAVDIAERIVFLFRGRSTAALSHTAMTSLPKPE